MAISFTLNGSQVIAQSDPATPLLDVLRGELGLTGTKQGCDHEGECGACTVLLDGHPVRSCLTPLGKVAGREVLTVEGLAGPDGLHPLQAAFVEVGAVQCGYCTPGMLLSAKALLHRTLCPSRPEIIAALEGNLCRCTGYAKIVQAVELAAARLRGDAPHLNAAHAGPRPIGGSALRSDSLDKVTGKARYAEDLTLPGMLHSRVLRSPLPHARLSSSSVLRPSSLAEAGELPGVIRILTAADVPGSNGFAYYSQDEPVLPPAGATLRTIGAPIALVIAESPEQAERALAILQADLEPLPHAFDLDTVLADGAVPIAGEHNQLATWDLQHGDLEATLTASDHCLESCYETAFLEHAALEREALLGYLDEEDRITVIGGCHEPNFQRGYIADALALPPDQIRVIVPPTGGSFGGKQDPWPFIATALGVFHTRRPVRLVYTRRESFDASPKRHPYRVRYRMGATADGRLTGVHVRIDCNTGGYDGHGQYIPNFALTASGGPYRWPAVDGRARSVYTNGPKGGQFRGFGTGQSNFALECTLDELAQELGLDPLDLRLRNAITEKDWSFLGHPVGESLGYREVLEAVRPQYQRFLEEARQWNQSRVGHPLRRGVGLAGMWYRFGKSGSVRIEAHAELAQDGHLIICCSAPDYGQGTNTVMSQMAAEAFGVDREWVEVVNADTALVPYSGIQGASRATYFVGGAVREVSTALRSEVLGTAAELLDCDPDSLVIERDRVIAAGADCRGVSLAEVGGEFDRMGKPRRVAGFFDLASAFPAEIRPEYLPLVVTGAHLADVSVRLDTGEVKVRRMVAAHDVGRAVNPLDAEGQIEGAVLMGLGAALMEEVLPGQTTGLSDYYLPTAQSMPELQVILVEVPSRHGPYGVKGLGEAAMLPSTPAIINAVSRAIGVRLRTIPATPERVLQAIQLAPAQQGCYAGPRTRNAGGS
jgi:CO/xanthine dehydrogenase Mo-binding subunit/aerobic-type carbon monoxide dehydrogenase small subunit (CoxS/CutS family)